jgi:hypothetical protein
MARKRSGAGAGADKRKGGAQHSRSSAKKASGRRKASATVHKAKHRLAIGEGHIDARDKLLKRLGGHAAMLAHPYPSSSVKGQNNLVGISVGLKHTSGKPTGDLAIRVFVSRKVAISRVNKNARVPARINGYPTDVVQMDTPRLLSSVSGGGAPVPCGTFIHNGSIQLQNGKFLAGTLGCLVVTADGTTCIMSCNHVMANLNQASLDDPIQAGQTLIARLLGAGKLVEPPELNTVDVALASVLPGAVSDNLVGLALSTPPGDIFPGDRVQKSGAQSGVTLGTVTDQAFLSPFLATLESIDENSNMIVHKQFMFKDQIVIQSDPGAHFSLDGDSGSIVELANTGQPIGLLFGGDGTGFSFANPLASIFNTLSPTLGSIQIVKLNRL